jgi:protein TonB
MPEIPADLILDAGEIVVVARFLVAADGVAQVELTGPTPEAKLNEVLLAALQKWRFTPAFRDGRAVESTVEARLEISLRDQ